MTRSAYTYIKHAEIVQARPVVIEEGREKKNDRFQFGKLSWDEGKGITL